MGSDDESAPDTAPLLRWLESLGIPTAAAEKTVKQLVADGYSTVIEVKRLASPPQISRSSARPVKP